MGVTLFNDGNGSQYYRVTKSWDGNHVQEYFHTKSSAEERNAQLERRKRAYDLRRQLLRNKLINDDGKITGLAKQIVRREGRKDVEVFKLRCVIPGDKKPKFSTISIQSNGLEGAFHKVIDKIANWFDISKKDEVYKLLLQAGCYYGLGEKTDPVTTDVLDSSSLDDIERGLKDALKWHGVRAS